MADEFEWQTEIEGGWEPDSPEPDQPGRNIGRRTKLVLLIAGVCLLSATALWVYGSAKARVRDATTTAETGVRLSHELLVGAVLKDDRDLARTLIARRPASWYALNSDLLAGQLFLSKRPLGIEVTGAMAKNALSTVNVQLSPELDSAEILDRRPYSVMDSLGVTETVVLERLFHYELLDGHWSLAPLSDERGYWGNWIRDERDNITVTYPGRDEIFALNLSRYLDSFVPQLCEAPGMGCPDGFHLEFKLETDLAAVRRLQEGLIAIRTGSVAAANRLVLPAPSLVGAPVDEAGYKALERGYAGWIGAAIIAGLGASELLPGEVLAQFDLEPPPAPFMPLPDRSPASFPAGVAVPNQDVLMLCNDMSHTRLLRFRTSDGLWIEEAPGVLWQPPGNQTVGRPSSFQSLLGRLPNYSGAIVQITAPAGSESIWRTFLWQDGVARLLIEDERTHYYLPPRLQAPDQPNNGKLVFYLPPAQENSLQFTAMLVDLARCDSTPCDVQELPGIPVWSPDGQHSLLIVAGTGDGNEFHLADRNGKVLGASLLGQSPIWLDEDRFVFIEREPSSQRDLLGRSFGQRVVTAVVDDAGEQSISSEVLFDAEIVRRAIPDSIRPQTLDLWSIYPALQNNTWWFISATGIGDSEPQDYVLVFNSSTYETRLIAPLGEYRLVEMPLVNATRSQAVIIGLSKDGSEISVEMIDASSGEMKSLANHVPSDWSADGQWLLQLERGIVNMVSATGDQQWSVDTGTSSCLSAIWFDKISEMGVQ